MIKELTTLFTGRHLTTLLTVDSTNSYMAEALKFGAMPEGAAIRALSQKSGRGQSGTRWSSDEGKNLLLSYLFYPFFLQINDLFLVNKAFSLGVYDYASNKAGRGVRIKWPNDIYWKDYKLAGILIENALNSSGLNHSILGVGLNVNQDKFPSTLYNPVSLKQILKTELNLDREFAELSQTIEYRYLQLKRGEKSKLDLDYHNALYRLEEWRFYESGTDRFKGKIKGVHETGKLLIEKEDGIISDFAMKEIKFL